MTIGILFVIAFAVAALVFAAIVIVRVLKKEEKQIGANNETNGISVPLAPRESYRVAILVSILIGLIIAVVVYFAGMN